jgi:hypothetical protein
MVRNLIPGGYFDQFAAMLWYSPEAERIRTDKLQSLMVNSGFLILDGDIICLHTELARRLRSFYRFPDK